MLLRMTTASGLRLPLAVVMIFIVSLVPSVGEIASDTGAVTRISWQSESNVVYRVQWSITLAEDDWHDVGNAVTGNGQEMFLYDAAYDADMKAYRIVVEP